MRIKHLVVVGASAGGIEALREVVGTLHRDLPAAFCIVLHTSPQSPGVLDSILSRAGPMPAANAVDRQRLEPGHIYIAPPDRHLVIEPGLMRVTRGPRENRFRPAIDPLFRSAAQVYGPAAIGVILTGSLDDGTTGLWTIKQLGGTAIVQDPDDALFPAMPRSALNHVRVDYCVPLREIAPLLIRLTSAVPLQAPAVTMPESLEIEVKIAKEQNALQAGLQDVSAPSLFACPECRGVLLQLKEGGRMRFRCHTGHAYSMETLLAGISEDIEQSLWSAVRALEEGEMLLQAAAEHYKASHGNEDAAALADRAEEARRQSDAVRKLVTAREPLIVKS